MSNIKIAVYIACPYSLGDVAINVRDSMVAWDKLTDAGFYPYNPLMSHFQHMHTPREYVKWLEIDMEWLHRCDCVLRIPGPSAGADKEVEEALSFGIPVFRTCDALIEWAKNEGWLG